MKTKPSSFLWILFCLFTTILLPFALTGQPRAPLPLLIINQVGEDTSLIALNHQTNFAELGQEAQQPLLTATSDICTWIGGNSATWEASAANWSCGRTPSSGDNVLLNSGTLTLANSETVSTLTINGGVLLMDGNYTLTVTSDLDHNGGDLGNGGGNCIVNGLYTANFPNATTVNIGIYLDMVFNGGAVINNANIKVLSNTLTIPTGKTMTLNATLGSGFSVSKLISAANPATLVIQPSGVLRKIGSKEVTLEAFSLNNQGTIRNETGSAGLLMGYVSGTANSHVNGSIYIADGAEIIINGGTHDLSNCSISGGGLFTSGVNNAVLNMSGTTTFSTNMRMNAWYNTTWNLNGFAATVRSFRIAGTVTGSGDITATEYIDMDSAPTYNATGNLVCNGNMTINYGTCTVGGSGNLMVGGNLVLVRQSSATVPTILNLGRNTTLLGNPNLGHSTNILNVMVGATFEMNNSANRVFLGSGSVTINGTFLKSNTNTIYIITNPLTIAASGQVVVNSGTILMSSATTNAGTVKGAGAIDISAGAFTNNGTFAPGLSPGTLTVYGNYINSTLQFEIGASGAVVNKDLLNVSSGMTLNGTLDISYLGGTVPVGFYDIAVCGGTRTGEFTTVNYPAACNGNCFINYGPNSAQLVVGTPLPLELLSFTANALPKTNDIRWTTANERNIANHLLERSPDGLGHWQEINRQAGNLQSTSERQYHYEDAAPLIQSYYRLRSIDLNGSEQVGPIVQVVRRDKKLAIISAYPVPVQNELNVVLAAPEEGEITMEVMDFLGRVILRKAVNALAGVNNMQLSLRGIPAGTYQLVLRNGQGKAEAWTVVKD